MNTFNMLKGGEYLDSWIQNHCLLCGWKGQKHMAHNDWQWTNCDEERKEHPKKCSGIPQDNDTIKEQQ